MSTRHGTEAKKTVFDGDFEKRTKSFFSVFKNPPKDRITDKYYVLGQTCIRFKDWPKFKADAIKNEEGLCMDPKTQCCEKPRLFINVDDEILDQEINIS